MQNVLSTVYIDGFKRVSPASSSFTGFSENI